MFRARSAASPPRRVLVIKLGAFGDFILALGAFAAIRRHHADAHITLLTIPGLRALAEASGYFDAVWTDTRSRSPGHYWRMRQRLRAGRFDRVYDLQTQGRTARYFHLLWPGRPEWSGVAWGCSHPDPNPRRRQTHAVERFRRQLASVGITDVPPPDVSWIDADVSRFGLPSPYALLVPGSAPHRPEKRWPAAHYAELARRLAAGGVVPVLLGTRSEAEATTAIAAACSAARDLTGATSLFEIAGLARRAALAVGNDTGPMHLIAAAGCPSLVLYSHASDPEQTRQHGPRVAILQRPTLEQLTVDEVAAELARLAAEAVPEGVLSGGNP